MITIIIEGPDHSGKSHAVALIGKYLRSLGCNVTIQSEKTHNAEKLGKDEHELMENLLKRQIVIKTMRTSV